jgi:hypothetical protein
LNTFQQNSVIEKGFPAFKVDRLDRAKVFALSEDLEDVLKGHCTALPGAAPHKAVIAFQGALVRHEQVKAGELHIIPPWVPKCYL